MKLFKTSNFSGPCYHEALSFSGIASLFQLFVYCFLNQFCEAFRELRGAPNLSPYHDSSCCVLQGMLAWEAWRRLIKPVPVLLRLWCYW